MHDPIPFGPVPTANPHPDACPPPPSAAQASSTERRIRAAFGRRLSIWAVDVLHCRSRGMAYATHRPHAPMVHPSAAIASSWQDAA